MIKTHTVRHCIGNDNSIQSHKKQIQGNRLTLHFPAGNSSENHSINEEEPPADKLLRKFSLMMELNDYIRQNCSDDKSTHFPSTEFCFDKIPIRTNTRSFLV